MKSARRLVLSAAAHFGMVAAAFLVLMLWPIPVSMRPIAETVPESVPILARRAVERSYGPHSAVSFGASRLLMPNPDERTINRWRIDGMILAARIRLMLGRERAAAYVAESAYYGAGLTGFAGASSRYFCIEQEELSLAQTAAVAALSIAPTSYPSNETQWRTGRDRILTWMMVEGDVAAGNAEAAMAEPLAPCGG